MTLTTTSSDGTSIAYEVVGDGPALVLVGGATSHRALDPTGGALAELLPHHIVVRYDRRGRGESGDSRTYAVAREIDDLDAVIAAVGGSAAVMGESSGAVLALEAARHGSAITRLAVYEPPFIVDDSVPPMRGPRGTGFDQRFDALVEAGRRADAFELLMVEAAGQPAEAAAAIRHAPMWPALEAITHTIAYDGQVMGNTQSGDPAALARYAAVTIPTLVIVGGDSPPHQQRAVAELAARLPDVRLRTLPGQGHQVAPEAVAPILAAFFRDDAGT
jgi:pimeloyl-ACP methyl ester carboxylesterase